MVRQTTTGKELTIVERRAKAIKMRMDEHTFQEIADELEITVSSAFKIIKRAKAKRIKEMDLNLDHEILDDLDRVDRVISGLRLGVATGEPQAGNTMIKALDHRAKLLGLYAKDRIDGNGLSDAEIDAEIDRLIQERARALYNEWIEGGGPPAIEVRGEVLDQ